MSRRAPAVVFAVAVACCTAVAAPLLLAGRILAFGDGEVESYPAFVASWHLWNPDMLLGYAVYADPNAAFFYPLRLLHAFPYGFNAYVVLGYAIAAAATFGYAFDVTRDRSAAAASALSFVFGGFMISHLGHPMIVQPAAWTIVALWAVQRYLSTESTRWLAVVATGIAISCTAGQPQITLFAVVLLSAYGCFVAWSTRDVPRSLRLGGATIAAVLLGVGIGSVAIVPAVALAIATSRSGLTFATFVGDSLPVAHAARSLVFPFVTGGGSAAVFPGPLVESASATFVETSPYAAAASIALAVAGAFMRPRRVAAFWTIVVVASLALAVGPALPFAAIVYGIPPFNAFRIPGRHAYELTLAISILAGFGVASFAAERDRRLAFLAGIAATTLLVAGALADVATHARAILSYATIATFLALDVLQAIVVTAAILVPLDPRLRRAMLASAIAIGGIFFAATSYARDAPSWASVATTPAYVAALRREPIALGQRVYAYGADANSGLEPNLPQLWHVPDVAGYTPLLPRAIDRFLDLGENGRLLDPASRAIDAAAVRYLAVAATPSQVLADAAPFGSAPLGIFLSSHVPTAPRTIVVGLRTPIVATGLALVSALGESIDVPQGAIVATVEVVGADGVRRQLALRAGVETAEIAYDRPDVRGIRHLRAAVYARYPSATWYVATLPFARPIAVRSVRFRVTSGASLNVRFLSLVDRAAHRAYPISTEATFEDPSHYRAVGTYDGVALFENVRARPRAWTGDGPVDVERAGDERRDYTTHCARPCTLVSSDAWSGDWHVAIDGRAATLLAGPDVLESVAVPSGTHRVSFAYRPRTLLTALAISVVALSILIAWLRIAAARRPCESREATSP